MEMKQRDVERKQSSRNICLRTRVAFWDLFYLTVNKKRAHSQRAV